MPVPRNKFRTALSGRSQRAKPWAITLAATAASTYVQEVVITAAGIMLAASHLLQGFDLITTVVFVAGTYIAWIAGLVRNLEANWALLEATGTSTNALSKAAYDLVKSRSATVRARKVAAATGYACTEIGKEVPYYVGAFGAAFLSDLISANDALIFLGGANLGAAAYEYGLARLTTAILQKKAATPYASFETDWVPREYLQDYYSAVEKDERDTIAFFVNAVRDMRFDGPVLFFGVGPTLHHVFLAAGKAPEIHLGDYLPANLIEIERWIRRHPDAHDWRPFVRYTLECEGVVSPSESDVKEREELARATITRLLEVDLRRADPLSDPDIAPYAMVVSAYCADSATGDRSAWRIYMQRIVGLVRPGGALLTAALRRSRGYRVGGKTFPSANVDESDLRSVLEPCFAPGAVSIEFHELAETRAQGYSGIVLASANRRLAPQLSYTRSAHTLTSGDLPRVA